MWSLLLSRSLSSGSSRRAAGRTTRWGFTLLETMVVIMVIGVLLAIALPNFVRARRTSHTKACIANLKQIDAAKQQWAMDNNQPGSATPSATDLFGAGKYIV